VTDMILFRVERKERARLKTVKFNAKLGSFDSKGVSSQELKDAFVSGFFSCSFYDL